MSVRNNLLKALDASVGALLCQVLRLSPRAVNHFDQFPAIKAASVKRILLIRPGGMGDMVLLWPIIKLLKSNFSESEVDIVCEKRNTDVLKIEGFEGTVMTYDTMPFKFLMQLFRRKYDVVVDTEQFHHFSAVFAFFSGAPVRIGFKINPRRNPLYTHLVSYSLEGYEGDQFLKLIEPLVQKDCTYSLECSIRGPELTSSLLSQQVEALGAYAVIHSGASTQYKLWQPDKYLKLSEDLIEKYGLGVVFVGDKHDSKIAAEIIAGMNDKQQSKCLSLAGQTDLTAVASLIKKADLFIGSDSGLAHLAVAIGTRSIAIFGPSDYRKWGCENDNHVVVHKNLPCSPCFIFGYNKPCESIACMNQITPENLSQAVEAILKQR